MYIIKLSNIILLHPIISNCNQIYSFSVGKLLVNLLYFHLVSRLKPKGIYVLQVHIISLKSSFLEGVYFFYFYKYPHPNSFSSKSSIWNPRVQVEKGPYGFIRNKQVDLPLNWFLISLKICYQMALTMLQYINI